MADVLSLAQFNLYLVVFFLFTGYISKKATPAWYGLSKMAKEINTLSQLLLCIEKMPASASTWLQQQQATLSDATGKKSSETVALLNGILKRFDYRLNPLVFVPLNVLLFWDLQQMLAFARWKRQHASAAAQWLDVLSNTEAIASLATLAYNHPDFCFPQFDDLYGNVDTTALGHPLIPAGKRVVSDFATNGIAQVSIITGSNMAGKSTFLRSVGLAMVMGNAGAPVCATKALFSHMQVMSSMRIADNLAESTSTFYAELKKLKSIIDAVNAKQPVLLLLDEILRGTNSGDRHTGSAALIQQLIRHHAVGLIATHDLALANLAANHPAQVHNYHFDVQVAGEELYFDYALKQGVCQSLNASILMKKIGIEMEN
jgi:DNA mismatch repair ATPase MutS